MASSDRTLGRASFLLALAPIRPASSDLTLVQTAVTSLLGLIPPALGLPRVTERGEDLVLGVAPLLVHNGDDGEIIWGPGGLDIGVVRFLM